MAGNRNLNSAARAKKDKFYTQLEDIENELRWYREFFIGKTILCNCDDPFESNFFKYFAAETAVFESHADEILKLLRGGRNVGFATIGDPMFYSTYIYIFRLLKPHAVPIVTIPGVPAFLAIAAQIGRQLAYGNDILAIVPATADLDAVKNSLAQADAAVLMKVYKNFPEIVDALTEGDLLDEAVLVSRAGLDDEKIITDVAAHKSERLNYLSTILTRRRHHGGQQKFEFGGTCQEG